MIKITGITEKEETTNKWAYEIFYDNGGVIYKSDYDFNSEEEARKELGEVFSIHLENAMRNRNN